MTTYQSSFSRNTQQDLIDQTASDRQFRETGSGGNKKSEFKNGGIKMTSVLTGEQYRDYEDPQHNTHCQKTWIQGGDRALKYTDRDLRKTLDILGGESQPETVVSMYRLARNPKARIGDGPTTLPLENGESQFFEHKRQDGGFRKFRTDVTRTMNEQISYR